MEHSQEHHLCCTDVFRLGVPGQIRPLPLCPFVTLSPMQPFLGLNGSDVSHLSLWHTNFQILERSFFISQLYKLFLPLSLFVSAMRLLSSDSVLLLRL